MKVVLITWHVQSIIIMALGLMWLSPYGSFDPTKVGFYTSILCAVVVEFVFIKVFKFPTQESSK